MWYIWIDGSNNQEFSKKNGTPPIILVEGDDIGCKRFIKNFPGLAYSSGGEYCRLGCTERYPDLKELWNAPKPGMPWIKICRSIGVPSKIASVCEARVTTLCSDDSLYVVPLKIFKVNVKMDRHRQILEIARKYGDARISDGKVQVTTNKIRKLVSELKARGFYQGKTQTAANQHRVACYTCYGYVDLVINSAQNDKAPEGEGRDKETEMNFKQRFVRNAEKMAYRQGARKCMDITHAFILYIAHTQLNFDGPKLKILLEMLESDFGKALLSFGLGEGIHRFQNGNKILGNLAEEFQVSGLDLGAEAGLDKLLSMKGEIMPVVASLIEAIKVTSEEGSLSDVLSAWKNVEDSIPTKVRVAATNAMRIQSEQPKPHEAELEIDLDLESEAEAEMTPLPIEQYAYCCQ